MDAPDTPAERLRRTLAGFAYAYTNGKTTSTASSSPLESESASPKTEARSSDMADIRPRGLHTPKRKLIRKEGSEEDDEGEAATVPQRSPSKKPKRSYADPSVYSHLRELSDYLKPGLDGERSATVGHHFANPTNHFWSCLYEAGFTSTLLKPSEDFTLPERFNLGMTNLVSRPTAEAAELSKSEIQSNVPTLLAKITKYKPKIVCVVGVGIAEAIHSYFSAIASSSSGPFSTRRKTMTKKVPSKVAKAKAGGPGLLPFKIVHDLDPSFLSSAASASKHPVEYTLAPPSETFEETLFYAVSSTSGRVVRYQKSDKLKQFQEVKTIVTELKSQVPVADTKSTAASSSSPVMVNVNRSTVVARTGAMVLIYASKLDLVPA